MTNAKVGADPVKALIGILEDEDPGELKREAAARMLERKLGLR